MAETEHKLYPTDAIFKRSLLYVCILFSLACGLLFFVFHNDIVVNQKFNWQAAAFFIAFAIFTDFKGFPHPNFGYVSFDRIAQVASILVLGIIPAALINGLTSFIFPFINKDYLGNDKKALTIAAINNSAMMMLMILISGLLYYHLGGQISLKELTLKQLLILILLLITMQLTNSLFMRLLIKIRQQQLTRYFNWFTTSIELSSGVTGVLFALVFNLMNNEIIALFFVIMLITIISLNKFAHLQVNLEKIVLQRTKELKEKSRLLEFKATHDEMTGLVNRAFINNHIKKLLQSSEHHNNNIYIAFADIDFFKKINDTYSHDAGDVVLKKISQLLQQFCHDSLIIARFGGEEFLLCFSNSNKQQANTVCEEIRLKVKSLNFHDIHPKLEVTISIGITNAHDKSLHKTLIARADDNLYKAKDLGRNRIIYN